MRIKNIGATARAPIGSERFAKMGLRATLLALVHVPGAVALIIGCASNYESRSGRYIERESWFSQYHRTCFVGLRLGRIAC